MKRENFELCTSVILYLTELYGAAAHTLGDPIQLQPLWGPRSWTPTGSKE